MKDSTERYIRENIGNMLAVTRYIHRIEPDTGTRSRMDRMLHKMFGYANDCHNHVKNTDF